MNVTQGRHADQESQSVFDIGNTCVDLYSPTAKLLFAESAAAAPIHDPFHDQSIHRRNYCHGENYEPDTGPESNLRNTRNHYQLQECAKDVERRSGGIAATGQGSFKRVGKFV
jgi:hypothetical protein